MEFKTHITYYICPQYIWQFLKVAKRLDREIKKRTWQRRFTIGIDFG